MTDGHGGTTLVPVTVDILPANTAPAFSTPTVGDPNGSTGAVTGTLAITDAEADTPTYSIVDGPLNGTVTIDPATGVFVYTPTPEARHAAAADGDGSQSGGVPTTYEFDFSGAESVTPLTLTSDVLSVTLTGSGDPGGFAVFPSFFPGQSGYAVFTNGVSSQTLTLSFNQAIQSFSAFFARDLLSPTGELVLTAFADGVEVGSVSVPGSVEETYPQGTISFAGNLFDTVVLYDNSAPNLAVASLSVVYAPGQTLDAQPASTDEFTVAVDDGHGGITTSRISVPILPANVAPTAVASTGTPDGSTGAVAGALAVSDADGDTTAVAAVTVPTRGTLTVDPATGAFTYTPDPSARHDAAADDAAAADLTDTFTLGVTDGHGGTIAVPVSVTIDPANTNPTGGTPVLGDPDATGTIIGRLAGTDADGDALTYRGSGTSASGAFVINPDGSFTYTPTADALAAAGSGTTDSFTITVDDGHGGVVAVPVTVTIAAGNNSSPGTPPAGCPTNCQGATVTFTGGTAFFAGGPGTTNGSNLFDSVDYYVENGFVFDYVGGSGGDIGNYYGTGNDVIHAHWGNREMTSIEIRKDGGGSFNFNYFVLTSNTLSPGGPAVGTEQVFIQGFLNGTATGTPILLTPEDWGFPASSVFTGTAFDAVDKVVITSTNGSFSCFGMDSFYIDSISV